MFLGLRKTRGVSFSGFEQYFGTAMEAVYGDVLSKHVADGLLCTEGGRVFLTERGLDLANVVMADFV